MKMNNSARQTLLINVKFSLWKGQVDGRRENCKFFTHAADYQTKETLESFHDAQRERATKRVKIFSPLSSSSNRFLRRWKNISRTLVNILPMAAIKPRHLLACKFVEYWESSAASAHIECSSKAFFFAIILPSRPFLKSDSKFNGQICPPPGLVAANHPVSHTPKGGKLIFNFAQTSSNFNLTFCFLHARGWKLMRQSFRWHHSGDKRQIADSINEWTNLTVDWSHLITPKA